MIFQQTASLMPFPSTDGAHCAAITQADGSRAVVVAGGADGGQDVRCLDVLLYLVVLLKTVFDSSTG